MGALELGNAVRERRQQMGLSQQKFAKRYGPSHQTLRNIEQGLETPRPQLRSLHTLEKGLGWFPGAAKQLLDDEIDVGGNYDKLLRDDHGARNDHGARLAEQTGKGERLVKMAQRAADFLSERASQPSSTENIPNFVLVYELYRRLDHREIDLPSRGEAMQAMSHLLAEFLLDAAEEGDTISAQGQNPHPGDIAPHASEG